MKKFVVNCNFGGQMSPFAIYIGKPETKHHPLHFQAEWLSKERGGSIPAEVMTAVGKLKDLAEKNNVSLEELCVYALGNAQLQSGEDVKNSETNKEEAESSNGEGSAQVEE
jgi:hypothetical protein